MGPSRVVELPVDALFHVEAFLGARDVAAYGSTSKFLGQRAARPALWQALYEADFCVGPGRPLEEPRLVYVKTLGDRRARIEQEVAALRQQLRGAAADAQGSSILGALGKLLGALAAPVRRAVVWCRS